MASAFFLWSATTSAERGIALGLLTLMLLALGVLLPRWAAAESREPRTLPRARRAPKSRPPDRAALRRLAAALLFLPGTALSALAVTTAWFTVQLGAAPPTAGAVAFALFAFPILWMALLAAAAMDDRLLRKTLVILGPGLVSVVVIFLDAWLAH